MFKLLKKRKRSWIYIGKYRNKKAILKKDLGPGNVLREGKWLKLLNKYKIGPRLFAVRKDAIIYEYVKGRPLLDLIEKRKVKKKHLLEILNKCRIMDKLRINKREFTRPYEHVLIGREVKMIDFERCYKSKRVKNVTQFGQFLMKFKKELGLKINEKKFRELLRKYKKKPIEKNFERIIVYLYLKRFSFP